MNKTLSRIGAAGSLIALLTGCPNIKGTISTPPQRTADGIVLTIQDAKVPNKTHTVKVVNGKGHTLTSSIESAIKERGSPRIEVIYARDLGYPSGTTVADRVYVEPSGGMCYCPF